MRSNNLWLLLFLLLLFNLFFLFLLFNLFVLLHQSDSGHKVEVLLRFLFVFLLCDDYLFMVFKEIWIFREGFLLIPNRFFECSLVPLDLSVDLFQWLWILCSLLELFSTVCLWCVDEDISWNIIRHNSKCGSFKTL